MDLYIANTSKQRHIVTYRTLEKGNERQYPIEPGGQRIVLKNGTSEEVEAIVEHYATYGMVEARTLDQQRDFVGLVYSVDKPVTAENIEKGIRDNGETLTRQSHEQRQASAAALEQQLVESGAGFQGNIEISAEQQLNPAEPKENQKIKEVIKTDKTAPAPKASKKKGK